MQSNGGGGGKGGSAIAVGVGLAVGVGGSGGAGGHGSAVAVHNASQGTLVTAGNGSPGLSAQSTGGGGGTEIPAVAISVGGTAGGGGNGGEILVTDAGSITTKGTDSAGIFALSAGGGGGRGGFAVAASVAVAGSVAVGVGGKGGDGGSGGVVNVSVADGSTIRTQGGNPLFAANSPGVYAHSTGGGGGSGGFSVAVTAAKVGASFGVGGTGGKGGNGAAVTVNAGTGSILTSGGSSPGIDAQSVGGGGGNGGLAISIAGGEVGALAFGMGGRGNAGGTGGQIIVANKANIGTSGTGSHGVIAQSVGGGGGNGGMSVAGGVLPTTEGKAAVAISIGGAAGSGGTGDKVTVTNDGNIAVAGDATKGITAQSVGKGGGNGGMSLAGTIAGGSTGKTFHTSFALGGAGGGGGDADVVKVTNTGNISTDGLTNWSSFGTFSIHNYGIFAQSVGGGGGNGGLAGTITLDKAGAPGGLDVNFKVAVGGSGGVAGKGGKVDVDNSGTIKTIAPSSSAIYAQSISNGGGDGGASLSLTIKKDQPGNTKNVNADVNVGGSGGNGNVGGAVTVDNTGALDTYGYDSHGIYAQSVGGGGGNGGNVANWVKLSGTDSDKGDVNYALSVKIGGSGGSGNNGGTVTVDNAANITTVGAGSYAIFASSTGAGGGNGGGSAGLEDFSKLIPGVSEEPVAGIPNFLKPSFTSLSLAVGGNGGAQGDGGVVNVTQDANKLVTKGLHSSAIYAQSVGGGGGTSVSGAGGTISGGSNPFTVSVGGTGKAGGNGGAVTVKLTNGAQIVTSAEPVYDGAGNALKDSGSYGIFAQSVGGGGGAGGSAKLKGIPGGADIPGCKICGKINIGWGLPISGGGGIGGNGDAVTVSADGGSIHTGGESSPAIFAQSVGGGGGIAGVVGLSPIAGGQFRESMAGTAVGSGADAGSGGKVTIDYSGMIATTGDASHGIFAQSVGGGTKTSAGATLRSIGGAVSIDFDGKLTATGQDAFGILAQSGGADGNGDVTITIGERSLVSGGSKGLTNNGAGIMIMDGAANTVTNAGTITSLSKIAIAHTGQGTVTVHNTGTIDGDVLLGGSASLLENQSGGVINADVIDLGGGVLNNHGVISPGGSGSVGATQVTGTLFQGSAGHLMIDLNPALKGTGNLADLLSVAGNSGFGGKVDVNIVNAGLGGAGEQLVTIVQADEIVNNAVLTTDSAVAQLRLVQPSSRELALAYNIDFANAGILAGTNNNQDNVARQIESIYRAGALDSNVARNLIQIESADYTSTMNSLSAEIVVDNQIASLRSSLRFSDALYGCAERSGEYRYIRQGECIWGRIQGQEFKQRETDDNLGFNTTGWQIATGIRRDVGHDWQLGAALSWESNRLRTNGAGTSDGYQLNLGLSATRNVAAAEYSGSIALGYTDNELSRTPVEGSGVSEATQKVKSVAGHLRAAYLFGDSAWYFKPWIDAGVEWLDMPGFNESGDSPFALRVQGQTKTYCQVQPAFEIGTEIHSDNGLLIRPRFTFALTQVSGGATPSANATFASTPGGVDPFRTSTSLDRTQLDVGIGVDMFVAGGTVVRAAAFGGLSDNTSSYGGSLQLEMRF